MLKKNYGKIIGQFWSVINPFGPVFGVFRYHLFAHAQWKSNTVFLRMYLRGLITWGDSLISHLTFWCSNYIQQPLRRIVLLIQKFWQFILKICMYFLILNCYENAKRKQVRRKQVLRCRCYDYNNDFPLYEMQRGN